ncbi:MAG: pantoate--beta-alanine ligase [Elusimicrobia bacterium]|nr:pantoate--beta-alanine ligase [Elusimicrobiota bacterium]
MRIVEDPGSMSGLSARWRKQGERIGLVPTMGALHAGHASLIRRSRAENDRTVVSVFVNPTQFGPKEDFSAYPRPFSADTLCCRREGADALFHPSPEAMYPAGSASFVEVTGLSETLCGAVRPGHFRGVATVVLKLLNIVGPHRAYFGEKDFQQLVVIKRMARDLDLPVRITGCPTLREPDGLAMSSRNAYLPPAERAMAPAIHAALAWGAALSRQPLTPRTLLGRIRERLRAIPGASVDYVALVDPETLQPADALRPGLRLLTAVRLGRARLIDNVITS